MDAPLLVESDEDEESGRSAALARELRELRGTLTRLRVGLWALSAAGAAAGASVWYRGLPESRRQVVDEQALLASIPVVALFFTWFHIWLAIQMMFRPLRFMGLWQYGETGIGIGWQGVVPRKSHKMAKTAYSCAREFLLGPRDWLTAVDPEVLVAKMRPHVMKIVGAAMDKVCARHLPNVEKRLSPPMREELAMAAVEKIEDSFADLWEEFTELLCDKKLGIDNDGMVVTIFTQNKELLNHFFSVLGEKEFRFIERCGAALGFVCGIVQLIAFNNLDASGRAILLPMTGFFLGIVTNWLAILVCFKPCQPIPVRLFGFEIYVIQGLFLKRQKDVAVMYSKLLCDHFFDFHKVVDYLRTCPELWARLKEAYLRHNTRVFNQTLGSAVTCFAPLALGRREFKSIEQDLLSSSWSASGRPMRCTTWLVTSSLPRRTSTGRMRG